MSQVTTIEVADSEGTRFLGEREIFIQILALNHFQRLTLCWSSSTVSGLLCYNSCHGKPLASLACNGISSIPALGLQSPTANRNNMKL